MSLCNCVDRNYADTCATFGAGVLKLYVACFSDITSVTYDTADEYITAIGFTTASGYSSGAFFELEVPFESSMIDSPLTFNKQNNNYSFNPTASFKLSSLDHDVIKLYESFAKAKVFVIAELHGSRRYALGAENGLIAESGTLSSGTALNDLKGATLTLSSYGETKAMRELSPALTISSLIATL